MIETGRKVRILGVADRLDLIAINFIGSNRHKGKGA
jgi:hypothetical protein